MVAILLLMVVEGKFVAFMAKGEVIHQHNGVFNYGVGKPYADFVHQLRVLCEDGDTNALARILRSADEHSRDIYEVWLGNDPDAYRKSMREILK
jgi:hypothetical protein